MENYLTDNTFLARWVSGELTSEELEASSYNKQEIFNKILRQTVAQEQIAKPGTIKLIPNWAYVVAASVIILFGVFYFINNRTHYETEFSEHLAVMLPDSSKVQLNSNSQLDFKSRQWENNREVTLIGEAFFDVEKGTSFKVMTSEGIIYI